MSVFISGTIFALLQLLIIFGFSWALFGVSWPNLTYFFIVTIATAISVGGICVLLTAISYRLNSEVISNFFSSIVVTLMSFLGGSFYPIGDASKFIEKLGNFTPNGAGMSAYMAILRGDGFSAFSQHVLFLIVFAVIAIVIATKFSKKGGICMIGILLTKCRMFIRNPWTFLVMTAMSIGFALVLGGTNPENAIKVPVFAENESIQESIIVDRIEESDVFEFEWMTEDELTEQL